MKVKNDHCSKFSNLSNWKEEAWKNQGFNGIQTDDQHEMPVRCSTNWASHLIFSRQHLKFVSILRAPGCQGQIKHSDFPAHAKI